MRAALLIVGLLGALLFGGAFVMALTQPAFVESMARELVRLEVERRAHSTLQALDGGTLAAIGGRMAGRHAEEM